MKRPTFGSSADSIWTMSWFNSTVVTSPSADASVFAPRFPVSRKLVLPKISPLVSLTRTWPSALLKMTVPLTMWYSRRSVLPRGRIKSPCRKLEVWALANRLSIACTVSGVPVSFCSTYPNLLPNFSFESRSHASASSALSVEHESTDDVLAPSALPCALTDPRRSLIRSWTIWYTSWHPLSELMRNENASAPSGPSLLSIESDDCAQADLEASPAEFLNGWSPPPLPPPLASKLGRVLEKRFRISLLPGDRGTTSPTPAVETLRINPLIVLPLRLLLLSRRPPFYSACQSRTWRSKCIGRPPCQTSHTGERPSCDKMASDK
mmetsp:Transcript_7585/g.17867  ORF Transcript_7585/g.17867 Transcript_7585/m.17867 type:complete len:322 (-) Transcript_7585:74-1039(-)